MAYTMPGGSWSQYCYLVRRGGKEKMNIGIANWFTIFPRTLKDETINTSKTNIVDNGNFFKISDVFPAHRISRKPYLKFLADQVGITNEDEFGVYIEKICNWCGDDDILFVPTSVEQGGCILTASLVDGEKVGYLNHQIGRVRNQWRKMMSKYRVWKLTHFKPKKSANRQNFIMDGSATATQIQGEYVQVNGFTIEANPNAETEGETR